VFERKPGSPRAASTPEEYQRLRRILLGREVDEIEMIRARLDEPDLRSEETSKILARAVDISATSGNDLRRAMQPVVEDGMRVFARRDPEGFSDVLFPSIGSAIRKAVAAAMRDLMDALNQTLEQSMSVKSLQWRWEALRSGKSYGEIVLLKSVLFRVEQTFLIHRDTGILLEHRASDPSTSRDASMVSGMLTAIRDFVRDSFKTGSKDELETIQFGETSLWIQTGPRALLACAVRGAAPRSLREVMQESLERIHFTHYEALEHFRGDVSRFAETRPLLDACMLGRAPERFKGPEFRWRPIVILLGLALIGFLYWNWRDQTKWNDYLNLVREQPGLTVLSESRGWFSYRVEGLRDPMAVDPVSLLAKSKLDSSKVQQAWNPYLSLHPTFAARRRIEQMQESISRRYLNFENAQHVAGPAEIDDLDSIAADLRTALKTASEGQLNLRIAIAGNADPTGEVKANVELAKRRSAWTKQALIGRGIPAAAMTEESGAPDPYSKRRVTFRLLAEPL
jgi:outer membrane protein OmpA-like peptidoglycan-associated protein